MYVRVGGALILPGFLRWKDEEESDRISFSDMILVVLDCSACVGIGTQFDLWNERKILAFSTLLTNSINVFYLVTLPIFFFFIFGRDISFYDYSFSYSPLVAVNQ